MRDYTIGSEVMIIELSQGKRDEITRIISTDLTNLIEHLRVYKSNNRTELDRRFAIAITEAEKLDAYITQYILQPINSNE